MFLLIIFNSVFFRGSRKFNRANIGKKIEKVQRYCFEFPPSSMKSYCKIVADFANFSTILQEMWNSNAQLSRYEYPLEVQIDTSKKMVYFICKAHNEGCNFFIKMKEHVARLNELSQSNRERDKQWRAKLYENLDLQSSTQNQVSYYRTVIFKNEHNHSTMHERKVQIPRNPPPSKLTETQKFEQHKFNKIIDHYRRIGQLKEKKNKYRNGYGNYMEDQFQKIDKIRYLETKNGLSSDFMDQINGQISLLQSQITKEINTTQKLKKEFFGDKVIFICECQDDIKQEKIEKSIEQSKLKNNTKQELAAGSGLASEKSRQENEDMFVQIIESESQQKSIKGEPCLYFYSSMQMQKNLQYYYQSVNIICVENHFQQIQGSEVKKKKNISVIFCSTSKDRQCIIFAVAVICANLNKLLCKKSLIHKFFSLNSAKNLETIILTHGDFQMLQALESYISKDEKLSNISIVIRIPFCHSIINEDKKKLNKFHKIYFGKRTFIGQFTRSLFQHFYEDVKKLQKLQRLKLHSKKQKHSLKAKYPHENLYFPCAIELQKLLIKMVFTLSSQRFMEYLLIIINEFCFADYQMILIQQKLMAHKQKIFISQMKNSKCNNALSINEESSTFGTSSKKFLGLNLLVDLEGAVNKNFFIDSANIAHSWNDQKIVKLLITKANQNNCFFSISGKYWYENQGDLQNISQTKLKQSYIFQNKGSKDQISKKSNPTTELKYNYQISDFAASSTSKIEFLLLKKYPILSALQYPCSSKPHPNSSPSSTQSKSNKLLMKRLPYYNQSSLYMTQASRTLIFDFEIINMLRYSCIDLSDRIVVGPKTQNNSDLCILVWNQRDICLVRKLKKDGGWVCECQFGLLVSMPCRHILKAMRKYQCNMINSVAEFWYKK